MTDLKYEVLKTLYNSPRREATRKTLFDINEHSPNEIYSAAKDLASSNIIKMLTGSDKFCLTTLGAELYEQEQEARKEKTAQKRRYIFNIILTVATLLATILLSEPFTKLISWFTANKG